MDEKTIEIALLKAEIDWYREKVDATARALDQLASRAADARNVGASWAMSNAAKLVRRINDKSLLDAED